MAGCLLAVSAAIFGAACGNLLEGLPIQATCDQNGFVQIATTFVLALIANQGTFAIAGAGRKKTVEENLN